MSVIVNELNELLKPTWGTEKWILEGWNKISSEEKEQIKARMDELFRNGLPFEIKHDKLLYTYVFSLLAQLEVLAIQVPLRFEEKMSIPHLKEKLHAQLLDEIFHGLVFTKIVYALSAPSAFPPAYNENVEILCDFIRNEDCPKMGLVMLNLVAEGWIEEVFKSLYQQNIAPAVFEIIIKDEHRHVCEADLYREIGIPEKSIMREKLEALEENLLSNIISQPKYAFALNELLGMEASKKLTESLHAKHTKQLKKIKMLPSEQWRIMMHMSQNFFEKALVYAQHNTEVEMSPTRKVFMTQWNDPGDPLMTGQFDIDISCLDFFAKKFPPETLTTLMMQAVSRLLSEDSVYRSYLSSKKLYQAESSYLAIVVKLPECGDQVGNILFRDCHLMNAGELANKLRRIMQMMAYCFKKREEMEQKHPHLKASLDKLLYDFAHDFYPYPIPGSPCVSLSNIGSTGYSQAISPLRKQECLKFTLMTVEKKLVWNRDSNTFEPKDIVPVTISADHRIFDGNIPVPKILHRTFQEVFQTMMQNPIKPIKPEKWTPNLIFGKLIDKLLATNLTLGYQILAALQTLWPDFMNIEDIFSVATTKNLVRTRLETWMG